MIYLTGDTHIPIDIGKLSCKSFPKQQEMTRSDYVIVLGDFGLLWKKDETYDYWIDVLSKRTYTLLFLDGNHENFDWLDSLPVETWHGGRVHRIAENILHLMRGEIFEIGGSTFFTLGGAVSYDKVFRAEGISWWPQERPSWADFSRSIENLARHDNHVDYVLTHTAPATILQVLRLYTSSWNSAADRSVENALQAIDNDIHYKGWYFGHWHLDFDYKRYHALYNRVVRIL